MKLSNTLQAAPALRTYSQKGAANSAPSGSVDRVTLNEAGQIAMAAVAGAGAAALAGFAGGRLGGWGIPAAVAGESILGIVAANALTRGAHDGSVSGGLMVVGAIGGAVAGGIGSVIGLASHSMFGVNPALGAAVAGAVAAGGFATYLAVNN